MAKVVMRGNGDIDAVASRLHKSILDSGLSVELAEESRMQIGDVKVILMVYDKYYQRAGNRVSLTVQLVGDGSDITVVSIGSGGGQGALFRFNWFAEEDFSEVVIRPLRNMGFYQQ